MQKRVFLERDGRSIQSTPWRRSGDAGRPTFAFKSRKRNSLRRPNWATGESNLRLRPNTKRTLSPRSNRENHYETRHFRPTASIIHLRTPVEYEENGKRNNPQVFLGVILCRFPTCLIVFRVPFNNETTKHVRNTVPYRHHRFL